MKFLWTTLILTAASGCVSIADVEGRPIGFDSYLAQERGGYTSLATEPAPVQTAIDVQPSAPRPDVKIDNPNIPAHRVVATSPAYYARYDKIERAAKASLNYGGTKQGRIIQVAGKTWSLKFVKVGGYDFAVIKPKGFKSQGRTTSKIVPDLVAATLRETSCNVSTRYTQRTYRNGGPTQYSLHLIC